MIGYRSVQHQGWADAKAGAPDEVDRFDGRNPYPKGSAAFYEYQDGCNAYRRGDVIDGRGQIAQPGAHTHKHANVHSRQGTGW